MTDKKNEWETAAEWCLNTRAKQKQPDTVMKPEFPHSGWQSASWNHVGQQHILQESARVSRSLSDLPKHQRDWTCQASPARARKQKQSCCLWAAATATPAWQRQGLELVTKDFLLSAHKHVFVLFVRCAAFWLAVDVSHWKQLSSSSAYTP